MVRIGFKLPGDNAISKLIANHDAPKRFCHAALIFGADLVCEAHAETGVRFHRYVPDPAQWVLLPVGLLDGEAEIVRQFCEIEAGAGYDMCGVLAIGKVPFLRADKEKWFCSELVTAALNAVGMFNRLTPHLVSPNALYLECERLGMTQ